MYAQQLFTSLYKDSCTTLTFIYFFILICSRKLLHYILNLIDDLELLYI